MIDWMTNPISRIAGKDQNLNSADAVEAGDRLSDEHLVRQVLAGQQAHFALLVERYSPKVLSLVLGIIGYRMQADAEDLVQAIFIKTWQNLDKFGFQSRFSTWFYRIAYNTTQDHLRRQVSRNRLIAEQTDQDRLQETQGSECDGLQQQLDAEFCRQLDAVVESLAETARVAVRCFYWLDKPIVEIAEILNTNENNVKSILFRARKSLKALLENSNDG